MPRILVLFLTAILLLSFQQPQKKISLEERRKKLIKEISTTSKLLNQTKEDRQAALDKLYTLQKQIQNRQQLVLTLEEEIAMTSERLERDYTVVEALQTDINRLKSEYGKTIRKTLRFRSQYNPLMYVLSSESVGQAFRRWQFLRQYDRFRRQQAVMINETREVLSRKIASLEVQKNDKETFLSSMTVQNQLLTQEVSEKEALVQSLKKDVKKLESDLKVKQKQHEDLNAAIESIIVEEMRQRRESARSKPSTPSQKNTNTAPGSKKAPAEAAYTDSPETIALSNQFSGNKGKLPWPVASGFITKRFGRQPHPTLKNIEITNNGVDIRTDPGADIKAVFEGKVVGVQFIPGYNNTVIIQHGNYYTVYSNLNSVSVSKGQAIALKQTIGKVSINYTSNVSELHFEVWKEKERLNPAGWLK